VIVAIENNQSHHHDVIATAFGIVADRAYDDIQYLGLLGTQEVRGVAIDFVQQNLPNGARVRKSSSMAVYRIVRN